MCKRDLAKLEKLYSCLALPHTDKMTLRKSLHFSLSFLPKHSLRIMSYALYQNIFTKEELVNSKLTIVESNKSLICLYTWLVNCPQYLCFISFPKPIMCTVMFVLRLH